MAVAAESFLCRMFVPATVERTVTLECLPMPSLMATALEKASPQ